MTKLKASLGELIRSPLFYAYWGINLLDKAPLLLPAGTLPQYGGSVLGVLVAIASAILFFQLLSRARSKQVRNDRSGAWKLFLAFWLFRLRLILLGAPLAIAMIVAGADKTIVAKYQAFATAPPGQNWDPLLELISAGGIWGALFLLFCLIDSSGTAIATAQGKAERSLRNSISLFPRAALPIVLFFFAEMAVGVLSYASAGFLAAITAAPLFISLLTTPINLLLQLGGTLFVGSLYLRLAPEKLRCVPEATSAF